MLRKFTVIFLIGVFILTGVNILPAAETPQAVIKPEPEYAPGELIVKLKEGKTLEDIRELNAKYNVSGTEKVFQDMPSPQEALQEMKYKLSKLSATHDSWYWQMDKDSKEYKDYIAKIEREKEEVKAQIKDQEELIARLEQRQKRIPEGIEAPKLDNVYTLKTDPATDILQMAEEYQQNPAVEYAQPNHIIKVQSLPNDTYIDPDQDGAWSKGAWGQDYEDLWGLKQIQADKAWEISEGEGVVVAVIDTGVDYNHEDLTEDTNGNGILDAGEDSNNNGRLDSNIWVKPGEDINHNGLADTGDFDAVDNDGNGLIDDIRGWDYFYCNNNPMDTSGHGTHVAGTIAALKGNSKGIAGVAPKAKIMLLRTGTSDNISELAAVKAVMYASDNGADILSNSWGGHNDTSLVDDAMRYAYSKGCIIIAGAGNNDGNVIDFYPACLPEAITVGAIDVDGARMLTSSYGSNYGMKVDVAAPGVNIYSLRLSSGSSKYGQRTGTSMACPHVSGVAALILSKDPGLSAEEIRMILRASADPLASNLPVKWVGHGRVNALKALSIPVACKSKITFPDKPPLIANGTHLTIKGIACGQRFKEYNLEYWINGGWQQFGYSNVPVAVDGQDLSFNPINVSGETYIRLKVVDTENNEFCDISGPYFLYPNLVGTPVSKYSINSPSLCISDINNDKKKEMIFFAKENEKSATQLFVYTDAGELLSGFSPVTFSGEYPRSNIVSADIDGDKDQEIFFATNKKVHGYHHNGTPLDGWPLSTTNSQLAYAASADMDGDGSPEVIFSGCLGFLVVKGNGTVLSNYSGALDNKGPLLVDINNDQKKELIIGGYDTTAQACCLYVFNFAAEVLAVIPMPGTAAHVFADIVSYPPATTHPVAGDMDGDGDLEIAVIHECYTKELNNVQKLFVWSYDNGAYTLIGSRLWSDYNEMTDSLSLADLDNDNDLEIIIPYSKYNWIAYPAFYFSLLEAVNRDGTLFWQTDPAGNDTKGFLFSSGAVVADIDNDKQQELIIKAKPSYGEQTTGRLYIYSNQGKLKSRFTLLDNFGMSGFGSDRIVVADLQNDNMGDILIANSGVSSHYILALSISEAQCPFLADWPEYQHDPQRSGYYEKAKDTTPPVKPVISAPASAQRSGFSFSWSSDDPESGIAEYQYRIRAWIPVTTCYRKGWRRVCQTRASLLLDTSWISAGANTQASYYPLKGLKPGVRYYISVRAKNGAGTWSAEGASSGTYISK